MIVDEDKNLFPSRPHGETSSPASKQHAKYCRKDRPLLSSPGPAIGAAA
jgi:hypothetical protein